MDWTREHDILFCREVIAHNMYQFKQGFRERGVCLEKIAVALNGLEEPWFKVDQRALRDRIKKLLGQYISKKNELDKASGVDVDEDELYDLLKNDFEVIQNQENDNRNKKIDEEKKSCENARNTAAERLSETKTREAEDMPVLTPKKTRSSGNSTIIYLREKAEKEHTLREQELDLKKAQLEIDARRQKAMGEQMAQQSQALMLLIGKLSDKV